MSISSASKGEMPANSLADMRDLSKESEPSAAGESHQMSTTDEDEDDVELSSWSISELRENAFHYWTEDRMKKAKVFYPFINFRSDADDSVVTIPDCDAELSSYPSGTLPTIPSRGAWERVPQNQADTLPLVESDSDQEVSDHLMRNHASSDSQPVDSEPHESAKKLFFVKSGEVSDSQPADSKLHESVGRFYFVESGEHSQCYSAVYIGQSTEITIKEKKLPGKYKDKKITVSRVLTAAHVFDKKLSGLSPTINKDKPIVFVPAFNHTEESDRYVVYKIERHQDYKECKMSKGKLQRLNSSNDICVLYIDEIPDRMTRPLRPLELLVIENLNKIDGFKVMGYASDNKAEPELDKIDGKYYPPIHLKDYEALTTTIQTERVVEGGISGGPWLVQHANGNFKVNGIQSSICATKFDIAISPTFREDLLKKLRLEYEHCK